MLLRLVSCLFLLGYSASAYAQFARPNFDQGVDAARVLQGIQADKPALPAMKAEPQKVQQYKLDRYPKESGPCVAIAQKIGADMARVAGVKVLRSTCEGEDANGYKITISYEAPERLDPVSTVGMVHPERGFGAYASLKDCQAALGGEAAAFREATGLEPVAAYCFSDELAQKNAWSIRIDSFGQAKLNPDTRSVLVFTYPKGWTYEKLTGQIKDRLKAQGVNVRTVAWRSDAGYASIDVSYYGAERIELKFEEPVKVDSEQQCAVAMAEFNKDLAGRTQPLVHYCGSTMVGGWELAWMYKDQSPLKTVKASDEFKSYEACMAGRAKVEQYYRESMGHEVLGSACSHEVLDYSWKVIVLE